MCQELPGQRTHNNDVVKSVGKATDGNNDPSKDPDHRIDAKNTTGDEPDPTLDSVELNTVGEANDTKGHPSQESDVTVNAENSNVDKLDIIHDSSTTIISNLLLPCRSCSFIMTTPISFCHKIGQNTKTLTFNESC
jgi:hypothetical protein